LRRVSRDGVVGAPDGVLDDYACLAAGLLALHQVTGDLQLLDAASALLREVRDRFSDKDSGGFYDTASDAETLVLRPQDPTDNASPSGWAAASDGLLTLAALTGDPVARAAAEDSLTTLVGLAASHPRFAGWGMAVAEAWLDGPREIAVVGDPADPATRDLCRVASLSTAPGAVVVVGSPGTAHPLLAGRSLVGDRPAAYVCRSFTCEAPTTDPALLAEAVGARRSP
jgi:uncharacterized protein YyaL (SSP411 family)